MCNLRMEGIHESSDVFAQGSFVFAPHIEDRGKIFVGCGDKQRDVAEISFLSEG